MSEPQPAPDQPTPARSAPTGAVPLGPACGDPVTPGGGGPALPTATQLDQLDAALDHVDAVLAQLDQEP